MNNVFSAKSETFAERCATKKILRSWGFLDILQNNDLGLSLFEVNPTFTAFDKVSHDKTTGIINKQPCN